MVYRIQALYSDSYSKRDDEEKRSKKQDMRISGNCLIQYDYLILKDEMRGIAH